MPLIVYDNHTTLLVKDNSDEVHIGTGQCVQYDANYYNKNGSCITTSFIGTVTCIRIQKIYDNSVYTGIYMKPEYVFIDSAWRQITDYNDTRDKNSLYPHLLVLPQYANCHNYNPIYTLHTVTSNTVDLTRVTMKTVLPSPIDDEDL